MSDVDVSSDEESAPSRKRARYAAEAADVADHSDAASRMSVDSPSPRPQTPMALNTPEPVTPRDQMVSPGAYLDVPGAPRQPARFLELSPVIGTPMTLDQLDLHPHTPQRAGERQLLPPFTPTPAQRPTYPFTPVGLHSPLRLPMQIRPNNAQQRALAELNMVSPPPDLIPGDVGTPNTFPASPRTPTPTPGARTPQPHPLWADILEGHSEGEFTP